MNIKNVIMGGAGSRPRGDKESMSCRGIVSKRNEDT